MEVNIWPWSTIRRLRDALADAKREATLWETSYERRAQAYDDAIGRENAIITLFNEHRRKFNELEDIRQSLETARVHQMEANEQHVRDNKALARKLAAVEAQLAEAQRNDTRDPKTGRFVKAER